MAARPGASSARRAVDLLFAFEKKPVATVKELAGMTETPLPTAHRYIAMLKDMGVVEEADQGEYRLTMRVVALAEAAKQGSTLVEAVDPYLRRLQQQTGETILLVQSLGGLPVCAHRIESDRQLRLSFETGQPLPALRGASAHLFVAAMPEDERRAYIEDQIQKGAAPPRSGIDGFLEEVEVDAQRGWAVSSEEIDDGVWSAAAMIGNSTKMIGTISVPTPVFRMNEAKEQEIILAVKDTAREVAEAVGLGRYAIPVEDGATTGARA